jgi:hypothetical protein
MKTELQFRPLLTQLQNLHVRIVGLKETFYFQNHTIRFAIKKGSLKTLLELLLKTKSSIQSNSKPNEAKQDK